MESNKTINNNATSCYVTELAFQGKGVGGEGEGRRSKAEGRYMSFAQGEGSFCPPHLIINKLSLTKNIPII